VSYAIGILFFAALFVVVAACAVTGDTPDIRRAWAATADRRGLISRMWGKGATWAGRNYLKFLMPISIVLLLWVLAFYAWKLLPITAGLLDRMQNLDTAGNAEAARNIAFAIAAFAGMLAVLATVPFRLVRAWIAERTARVAESNLTTDLINKAVEGLGAEKTVSRIGRPVAGMNADQPDVTEIQWEGAALPDDARPSGDWQTFDKTEPNLEVRIGAIYTLERIARENPEEHVRVMEILCAYIRENAPARDAQPNPLDPFPDHPETPTAEELEERPRMRKNRKNRLQEWKADLRSVHAPRTDIQTALEVIGRRSEDQIAREGKSDAAGAWTGYRLDLRGAKLQAADLADRPDRPMRFGHARLTEARMEGAVLNRARMEGADLRQAQMQGADLIWARMEGAVLSQARMEGAVLWKAWMEGAALSWARMEGAVLHQARMEGADLGGARMEGADLGGARMEGANLRRADLRSAEWAGGETDAPAHSADLRGAVGLTQDQLDQMIGNSETLLPETLGDGSLPSIPSCWATPPPFLDPLIALLSSGNERLADNLRAKFLCPEGTPPARTGTPLALDAPYPDGHPLADRAD